MTLALSFSFGFRNHGFVCVLFLLLASHNQPLSWAIATLCHQLEKPILLNGLGDLFLG